MNKINWKQKLTSRKWWAGLAGAVTMLLGILGVSESTVAQISEIIVGAGVLQCFVLFGVLNNPTDAEHF